jgi:ubiquitin C-terminal hydrolase
MPDMDDNDETVARKYWDLHLQRNQSVIVDLVQGQYKSTLTCPVCNNIKISFDPYMSVQLPIPQVTKVSYFFICNDLTQKTYQGQITMRPSEAD